MQMNIFFIHSLVQVHTIYFQCLVIGNKASRRSALLAPYPHCHMLLLEFVILAILIGYKVE